jgi:hypothetical protein
MAAGRTVDAGGRRARLQRSLNRQGRSAPPLDRIPDQRRDVGAAEALHLANAGRRGDVDLGEIIPDDIDADEDEPARLYW